MSLQNKLAAVLHTFPLPIETLEDREGLLLALVQAIKEGPGENADVLLFSGVCERARWALSRDQNGLVSINSADLRVLLCALGEV